MARCNSRPLNKYVCVEAHSLENGYAKDRTRTREAWVGAGKESNKNSYARITCAQCVNGIPSIPK